MLAGLSTDKRTLLSFYRVELDLCMSVCPSFVDTGERFGLSSSGGCHAISIDIIIIIVY